MVQNAVLSMTRNITNNDVLLVEYLVAKNGKWCGVVLSSQGVPENAGPLNKVENHGSGQIL